MGTFLYLNNIMRDTSKTISFIYFNVCIIKFIKLFFRPLKNEDFDSLFKEIEELFPTETCSTYYVPPIAKKFSRNNKSITSRGKLVNKYRNKIRDYRKLIGHSLTESGSTSTSTYNSELEGKKNVFLVLKYSKKIFFILFLL